MSDARDKWLTNLGRDLNGRRENFLLRELRRVETGQGPHLVIDGKQYVQFCTNNYLGLANDPEVIAAAVRATEKFGTGSGASRLVAGSLGLHHELEAALAAFKGTEAALVFSSGFMANLAVLTTFAGEGDLVVSDKLNHASLLDAAKFSGARHRTFPHLNYARARELLKKTWPVDVASGAGDSDEPDAPRREVSDSLDAAGRKFLVTDTVFSMDGDLADLNDACDAAEQVGALVVLDEAHGTGVLGTRGAGLAELQGVEKRIAVTVGTLSKALGSIGGFVAGGREMVDMLVNTAREFIYTTALPPACSAAGLAALQIVQREPDRRARVLQLASRVRAELKTMGYDCGNSASPIIPVIVGPSERALAMAATLRDRGLYVPAIRPPTVPPNSARLRISLMATHTDADVQRLLEEMARLKR